MSQPKKFRPSPALVIAVLALIVAFQGPAISNAAESLARKAGLSGKSIAKNSIPANRIKKNSITGKQIKEGNLGKVPSAASADKAFASDFAGAIVGSTRVWKKTLSSSSDNDYETARNAAVKIPLGSGGTFNVYGKCFFSDTNLYGKIYIETTANGAIVGGYSPTYWYGDLATNSPEDDRELIQTQSAVDSASTYDYGDFNAIDINGKVLTADIGVFVKHGSPSDGNGAYGAGDVCIFRYESRPVTTIQ